MPQEGLEAGVLSGKLSEIYICLLTEMARSPGDRKSKL